MFSFTTLGACEHAGPAIMRSMTFGDEEGLLLITGKPFRGKQSMEDECLPLLVLMAVVRT